MAQLQQQPSFPAAATGVHGDNNTEKVLCVMEAIHDFEARGDDELTLLRGELVEVIENDGETLPRNLFSMLYPTPAVAKELVSARAVIASLSSGVKVEMRGGGASVSAQVTDSWARVVETFPQKMSGRSAGGAACIWSHIAGDGNDDYD